MVRSSFFRSLLAFSPQFPVHDTNERTVLCIVDPPGIKAYQYLKIGLCKIFHESLGKVVYGTSNG